MQNREKQSREQVEPELIELSLYHDCSGTDRVLFQLNKLRSQFLSLEATLARYKHQSRPSSA